MESIVLYVTLDALFIGLVARTIYTQAFPNGLRQVWPAVLVYAFYPIAVAYFTRAAEWQTRMIRGMLLGATVYGVYHLTNLATLPYWDTRFMVVDWLWGTLVTAALAMKT